MVLSKALVPAAMLAALLAGCNKTDAPPEPRTSDAQTGAQTGAVTGSTSTVPGAATPSAAADTVPPATSGGPTAAGASGPSQANPATLSKSHESSAMPMEGQANNYSPAETASQRASTATEGNTTEKNPK